MIALDIANSFRHIIFENGCFSVEPLRHLGPS